MINDEKTVEDIHALTTEEVEILADAAWRGWAFTGTGNRHLTKAIVAAFLPRRVPVFVVSDFGDLTIEAGDIVKHDPDSISLSPMADICKRELETDFGLTVEVDPSGKAVKVTGKDPGGKEAFERVIATVRDMLTVTEGSC